MNNIILYIPIMLVLGLCNLVPIAVRRKEERKTGTVIKNQGATMNVLRIFVYIGTIFFYLFVTMGISKISWGEFYFITNGCFLIVLMMGVYSLSTNKDQSSKTKRITEFLLVILSTIPLICSLGYLCLIW